MKSVLWGRTSFLDSDLPFFAFTAIHSTAFWVGNIVLQLHFSFPSESQNDVIVLFRFKLPVSPTLLLLTHFFRATKCWNNILSPLQTQALALSHFYSFRGWEVILLLGSWRSLKFGFIQLNQGVGLPRFCLAACKYWILSVGCAPCRCDCANASDNLRGEQRAGSGLWSSSAHGAPSTTTNTHCEWGFPITWCNVQPCLCTGTLRLLLVWAAEQWNPFLALLSQFTYMAPPSHPQQLLPRIRMVKAVQSVSSPWPSPNYQENILKISAWVVCRWLMESRVQKSCQ